MLGNIFKIVRVPRPCSIQELEQLFNKANKTYIAKQYINNNDGNNNKEAKDSDKEKTKTDKNTTKDNGEVKKGIQCRISSRPFIMYYLILLFLLCFATPVLITTSLNVFIQSAVQVRPVYVH